MDERQWIRAIRRGEKQYLQDIIEKYYDDIFRFCAFWTGSREDAYDLAQETFMKFIRYVENYRSHSLKGYLLTIAMNLCRDHMTRNNRRRQYESSMEEMEEKGIAEETFAGREETPEEAALEAELSGRLMRELSRLPCEQREALLFHYLHDMKYREIARLTGVPAATVKSRVRQGMEKLRKSLKKEDFLDG